MSPSSSSSSSTLNSPLLKPIAGVIPHTARRMSRIRKAGKILVILAVSVFVLTTIPALTSNRGQWHPEFDLGKPNRRPPRPQPYRLPDYLNEKQPFDHEPEDARISGPESILDKVTGQISSLSSSVKSFANSWTPVYSCDDSLAASAARPGNDMFFGMQHHGLETEETLTISSDYSTPPLIAKVTIVTGEPNIVYERALRTHIEHNAQHNYAMQTLRQAILADVWSKPAYLMSVILRELSKPAHRRLQWIFWVDADTIIINPKVPLEAFLPPPTKEWEDVNMLITDDWNGLNNGVFPIRVCSWSVQLLASVLAFPVFKPDEDLKFRDQTAMEHMLKDPYFKRHAMHVPQRWFNAYQGEVNDTIGPFQTRPGDMLVHFAGVGPREERMEVWLQRAEEHRADYEVEFSKTSLKAELAEFWQQKGPERKAKKAEVEKLKEEWHRQKDVLNAEIERWSKEFEEAQVTSMKERVSKVDRKMGEEQYQDNPAALEEVWAAMKEDIKPLQELIDKSISNITKTARLEMNHIQKVMFDLELEDAQVQKVKPEITMMEDSLRRLQHILKSKIMSEEQLIDHVKNLTDSKEVLRVKISEVVEHEYKFPADVEVEEELKMKEEELKKIKEQIEKDVKEAAEAEKEKAEKERKEKEENERAEKEKEAAAEDDVLLIDTTRPPGVNAPKSS